MSISFGTGLTTILGPNGAGKTTLLKTLATVIPPFQGHIEIDGIRVENEADALKVRHKIGYLPQNFGFDPAMTVENFVTYGAWVRGTDKNQRKNQVIDAISKVDLHEQRNISHWMDDRKSPEFAVRLSSFRIWLAHFHALSWGGTIRDYCWSSV